MAAPLEDGEVGPLARKAAEPVAAMRGVDFVMTSSAPFLPAMKDETDRWFSLPLDPDPVRLSDHTWRLFHGNVSSPASDGSLVRVPLGWVIGEDADVFSGCWVRYPLLLPFAIDATPLPLRMADSIVPYHLDDPRLGVHP